ncbi:hypothetical protein BDQ17DRAFT_957124 [Cyathus striatus]|nr:hypothetical protein BDQ17DRAFT_957124 [Cyathus striatus]
MPIAQRTLSRYRTALHGLPFRAFSISSPAPALQFPQIWATKLPVTRLSEPRVQAQTLHAPPYFPSVVSSIPTSTPVSRILYRQLVMVFFAASLVTLSFPSPAPAPWTHLLAQECLFTNVSSSLANNVVRRLRSLMMSRGRAWQFRKVRTLLLDNLSFLSFSRAALVRTSTVSGDNHTI